TRSFFQRAVGIRDGHVTGVQTCALPICPGDEILISTLEHNATIVPWQLVCEQTGCTLKVAPINARGELELEELLELLGPRTRLEIGRASCRERRRVTMAVGSG